MDAARGKPFLIRNVFEKQLAFEYSGIHNAVLAQQLENYCLAFSKSSKNLLLTTPLSWLKAIKVIINGKDELLEKAIEIINKK
jgi:hypothetical protein